MGNAATCKACGSDKALETNVSVGDLSQHTDYYRTADSGSELDGSLVSSETWFISFNIFC